MKNNDIDIYGLAETNLSYRQSKIWQHQFGFHGYFDYSQQGGKGQGVGIIVSDKYDIFVHKAVGHKGRVIYLDLNFSQKKNVRLIQVYINANKKERTRIEELYQYIKNIIDDAKNKNMEIIIMGDFNINYRKYLLAFISNRWYFKLFKMLENRHLLNTIPIFNEDDKNIYTYIPPNDSNEKSRIDYIWASLPILGQSLNSTVIENDHFTTNHNTVTLSLDTQLFIGRTLPKINKSKKKITCTVFLYDEMDQEDDEFTWDNFRTGLDHEIERLKLKDRAITKRKHVDHVWNSLRQLIMKSANENIRNKKIIKQKIKCVPEKKLSVYFDLRYIINRIQEIRSCITGLRNYPNQEMIGKWINYQNTIIKLKDKYELVTSDTSFNFLNNDQFHSYLDELNEIRKQLRI
ncbi:8097_t:CDS:1, partial [Rhizophagus irregularis]